MRARRLDPAGRDRRPLGRVLPIDLKPALRCMGCGARGEVEVRLGWTGAVPGPRAGPSGEALTAAAFTVNSIHATYPVRADAAPHCALGGRAAARIAGSPCTATKLPCRVRHDDGTPQPASPRLGRDRPKARLHPEMGRHRRQPARRAHAAPGAARQGEHRHHRLGRQRLPLQGERGLHGTPRLSQPGPSPQAAGTTDATPHPARQRQPLERPRWDRARLRPAEGADRSLRCATIGIVRAKVKIGLANLTYNIRRLVFHEARRGIA